LSLSVAVLAGSDTTTIPAPLEAARLAIAGGSAVVALRTLAASGRAVRSDSAAASEGTVNIFFDVDKYVRTDARSTGRIRIVTRLGFNGPSPIRGMSIEGPTYHPSPPDAGSDESAQHVISDSQHDLALMMLGALGLAPPIIPIEYSLVGRAETADGTKADVIGATLSDGFVARLFIDASSHLPLMTSWDAPEAARENPITLRSGGTTTSRQNAKETAASHSQATRPALVEHRLFFSERHKVGGLLVPSHIVRAVNGRRVEEVWLDSFSVNSAVNPKVFAPR
jgi:hypothetical protein